MIDQRSLQERLAALEQQRTRKLMELQQVIGAEQLCRQMLGELQRSEDEPTTQDREFHPVRRGANGETVPVEG